MYVISATHRRLGAAEAKLRSTSWGCWPRVTIRTAGCPLAPAYAVKARVSHQSSYPLASGVNLLAG